MALTQQQLVEIWGILALAVLPFSLFNSLLSRFLVSIVYIVFAYFSAFREPFFNSDTYHYLTHANGYCLDTYSFFNNGLSSWFEPGYNLLIMLITRFSCDPTIILGSVAILSALVFLSVFFRKNYHPAIMLYIFSTMTLVGSFAAIRHYLAASLLLLLIEYSGRKPLKLLSLSLLPISLHLSSVPVVAIVASSNFLKFHLRKIFFLVLFGLIYLMLVKHWAMVSIILNGFERFYGGLQSTTGRSLGLRNALSIVLILLLIFDFKKFTFNTGLIDTNIILVLIFSMLLILAPGLNRITSLLQLIILPKLNSQLLENDDIYNTPKSICISAMSIASALFLYREFH